MGPGSTASTAARAEQAEEEGMVQRHQRVSKHNFDTFLSGKSAVIQVFLARGAKFVSAVKTGSKNGLEGKLLLEGFSINDLEPFFFRPPKNGPQKYP